MAVEFEDQPNKVSINPHDLNKVIVQEQVTHVEIGIGGPQGVPGIQGIQGLTGVQGTEGYVGSDGTQGTMGPQGIQGLQGITGIQGALGIQGSLGLQGIQGTQGILGSTGVIISNTAPVNTDVLWADTSTPGTAMTRILVVTQSEYDAIVTKDPYTLYVVI